MFIHDDDIHCKSIAFDPFYRESLVLAFHVDSCHTFEAGSYLVKHQMDELLFLIVFSLIMDLMDIEGLDSSLFDVETVPAEKKVLGHQNPA